MYRINGGTYSANEIIGKTLFLKPGKTAVLYNAIGGNKTIQIKSGIVGVVYVWLVRDSGLWWEVRRGSEIWYVLHQEGLFDIKALQAQGALTTAEIIERQKEAEKNIVDKLLDKGTSILKTGLYIFGGVYLLKSLIS